MSRSSITGGERAATQAPGKDTDSLGPSDSSDSGSDVQGQGAMPTDPDSPDELGAMPTDGTSDSDALGTGERGSATGRDVRAGADILPDRVIGGPPSDDGDVDDDDLLDQQREAEALADEDGDEPDDDGLPPPPMREGG